MRPSTIKVFMLLALGETGFAATHYVDLNSPNPAPPYTNWATAAKVIQDAVDVAAVGDEVVVTNGIYATGGRAVGTNILANRVAVDKPLSLRSVNGPQLTIIRGYPVPGMTNGDGAIRCVYLTDGATLSGFTLSDGVTRKTGDDLLEQYGGGIRCASATAVVSNCVIAGNSAAGEGGGAYGGSLKYCTLTGNSAGWFGGGVCYGVLNNCTLTGNSASYGGGAGVSTLINCTLAGNSASSQGGGACGSAESNCTLNNCALTGNSAQYGGGADGSTLNNCTLTANAATASGGGAGGSTLNNCIIYFNSALTGPNYECASQIRLNR